MRGTRVAAFSFLLLGLTACSKEDALDQAKRQIQHVQEITKEFMADRMDAWNDQISKLDAELDDLRATAADKMADLSDEARAQLAETMILLERKREEVGKKLAAAGDASSAAWDEVETGFENAWEELQSAIQQAESDVR